MPGLYYFSLHTVLNRGQYGNLFIMKNGSPMCLGWGFDEKNENWNNSGMETSSCSSVMKLQKNDKVHVFISGSKYAISSGNTRFTGFLL